MMTSRRLMSRIPGYLWVEATLLEIDRFYPFLNESHAMRLVGPMVVSAIVAFFFTLLNPIAIFFYIIFCPIVISTAWLVALYHLLLEYWGVSTPAHPIHPQGGPSSDSSSDSSDDHSPRPRIAGHKNNKSSEFSKPIRFSPSDFGFDGAAPQYLRSDHRFQPATWRRDQTEFRKDHNGGYLGTFKTRDQQPGFTAAPDGSIKMSAVNFKPYPEPSKNSPVKRPMVILAPKKQEKTTTKPSTTAAAANKMEARAELQSSGVDSFAQYQAIFPEPVPSKGNNAAAPASSYPAKNVSFDLPKVDISNHLPPFSMNGSAPPNLSAWSKHPIGPIVNDATVTPKSTDFPAQGMNGIIPLADEEMLPSLNYISHFHGLTSWPGECQMPYHSPSKDALTLSAKVDVQLTDDKVKSDREDTSEGQAEAEEQSDNREDKTDGDVDNGHAECPVTRKAFNCCDVCDVEQMENIHQEKKQGVDHKEAALPGIQVAPEDHWPETPKQRTPKKGTPKKVTPKKVTPKKGVKSPSTPKTTTPDYATPKKATVTVTTKVIAQQGHTSDADVSSTTSSSESAKAAPPERTSSPDKAVSNHWIDPANCGVVVAEPGNDGGREKHNKKKTKKK